MSEPRFTAALGEEYNDLDSRFYFQMRLIRTVEEKLLELFSNNKLFGTTHTSIGQEANAVAIMAALDRSKDMVWSNHRCHGHFLAYSGNIHGLIAEIMGKKTGVSGGRGGSQHLCHRNFYSNGIQGGIAPAAVGCALAEKATGAISTVFIGDGTLGEGVLYESLNLASLWNIPTLFVCEHNGIAQTTPSELGISGDSASRAQSFGIRSEQMDSTDVKELHALAAEMVEYVRREQKPAFLHLRTVRLGPHSKGDDTRSEAVIAAARARDPLSIHRPRVKMADGIDARCFELVEEAALLAEADELAVAA